MVLLILARILTRMVKLIAIVSPDKFVTVDTI